jgi:hypothetical protein
MVLRIRQTALAVVSTTTVITSIGSRTSDSVNVNTVTNTTVSGYTNAWILTLSAAVPATTAIGDKITVGANNYLITSISGTDLTVVGDAGIAATTTAAPTTGAAITSRMYSTSENWGSGGPASLITRNWIWKGEIYKEGSGTNGEWVIATGTAVGGATDATRYYLLEPASGQGFYHHPNKTTNKLQWNNSLGVAIRTTGNYTWPFFSSNNTYQKFIARGLQIKLSAQPTNQSYLPLTLEKCIILGNIGVNGSAINCLIFGVPAVADNQVFINCTFYSPQKVGFPFDHPNYSGNLLVRNCAVYGFNVGVPLTDNSGRMNVNSTNNVTDSESYGWTAANNLTRTDPLQQFQNAVTTQYWGNSANNWVSWSTTEDFRVRRGSNLIGAGVRDQAYTNDEDILGQARNTTSPTVGCWEFSETYYSNKKLNLIVGSVGKFLPQRWRQQPQGPVQIDWNHSISQSLNRSIVITSAGAQNPARPKQLVKYNTNSANNFNYSTEGVGLNGSSSVGPTIYLDPDSSMSGATKATYFVYGYTQDRYVYGGVGDAPILTHGSNSIRKTSYSGGESISYGFTTGNFEYLGFTTGAVVSNYSRFSAGMVFNFGGTLYFYHQGKLIGTDTRTSTSTLRYDEGYPLPFQMGGYNGLISQIGLLWTRALSDNEFAALHENPWQIFKPARSKIYSFGYTYDENTRPRTNIITTNNNALTLTPSTTVVIKDNFIDTNGTALENHIPTGPGATGSWSTTLLGSVTAATIQSNTLYNTSTSPSNYYIPTGSTDHYVKFTLPRARTGNIIVIKAKSQGNFWDGLYYNNDGSSHLFYSMVNAYEYEYIQVPGTLAVNDVVLLETIADNVTLKINNSLVAGPFKHGFNNNNTGIILVPAGGTTPPVSLFKDIEIGRYSYLTNIDCRLGTYFSATISGKNSFTVFNVPTNTIYRFVLRLTLINQVDITWWNNVIWPNNVVPYLTPNSTHLLIFQTKNGGATWQGSYNLDYAT